MTDAQRRALARVLDDEFWRVAKEEDKPMGDLVAEVAATIGVSERHIYRYRSGRWPIPAQLIPPFCKRLKSRALMIALEGAAANTPVLELPRDKDYGQLAITTLRDAVELRDRMVAQWARPLIDKGALNELEQLTERVIHQHRLLYAMLESEYERRIELKRKKA